uniref:Uncharacterized protein n=1 Tax=Romanomermis culicivorax TaxID=13658 RepID=A0A915L6Y0_ROMCU
MPEIGHSELGPSTASSFKSETAGKSLVLIISFKRVPINIILEPSVILHDCKVPSSTNFKPLQISFCIFDGTPENKYPTFQSCAIVIQEKKYRRKRDKNWPEGFGSNLVNDNYLRLSSKNTIDNIGNGRDLVPTNNTVTMREKKRNSKKKDKIHILEHKNSKIFPALSAVIKKRKNNRQKIRDIEDREKLMRKKTERRPFLCVSLRNPERRHI